MSENGQVHWHEGLFLQPHHLQWMQRQFGEEMVAARRLTWSYPYGVVEARLSSDALENMLVQFDALKVVMPSGLVVSVPENTHLPALDIKQAFQSTSGAFTIRLGVPLWRASGANTVEGERADTGQLKRLYRVKELQRPDENSGENAQPVQMRQINARLLLEGDDAGDMEVLPLVRIGRIAGQDAGLPRKDPAFVAPCLVLAGSPVLRELVRDLAHHVEARRSELVAKVVRGGFTIDTMRGPQIAQIFRLRTLNRFGARLRHLWQAPAVTPFETYLELRDLLGELAALQPERDEYEVSDYDHDNPSVPFSELSRKIRKFIVPEGNEGWGEKKFQRGERMLSVDLTPEELTAPNEYFLGIRTGQDPRGVASLVEDADRFKFMAKSLIRAAVWGVSLAEERNPPPQLPAHSGLSYFRVLRTNNPTSVRMWERIVKEASISLRWPDVETSDFVASLFWTVPQTELKR